MDQVVLVVQEQQLIHALMGDQVELHHLLDLPVLVAVVAVSAGLQARLVVMAVRLVVVLLVVLVGLLKGEVAAGVEIMLVVAAVQPEQTLTEATVVADQVLLVWQSPQEMEEAVEAAPGLEPQVEVAEQEGAVPE